MPVYEYRCPACGGYFDKFLRLQEFHETQACPDCGEPAEKLVSAPAVFGDYGAYNCPVTGKLIEGRKAHEANLQAQGCRVLEPGEKQEAFRRRQQSDRELEQKLEQTAGEFVSKLSPRKIEQLGQELSRGVNVTVVRK